MSDATYMFINGISAGLGIAAIITGIVGLAMVFMDR
jgi:hypothetical protein